MLSTRAVRHLTAADRAAVLAVLDAGEELEGSGFDDHLVADLTHGPRDGFVGVLAHEGDRLAGYAQASLGNEGYVIGGVVSPEVADADAARTAMMTAVVAALPLDAAVTWWPADHDVPLAKALGLEPSRRLLQMHVPLPLAATTSVTTRPFEVGRDEEPWLEVNNAAFEWHGEQGGWDLATLRQREQEPWFDADGFLLHERDGRLAAFCWTKHHDGDGEIYVIAVHPDFHGLGLGRALTVAGLEHLHATGARRGMLYVDADNTPAVALYESLGFRTTKVLRSYRRSTHTEASTP